MQKVVTATMDSNLESNVATASVVTTAEVSEANGLKRKFTISRTALSEPSATEDSPASKRRKSSRNSTSGTVRQNLLNYSIY